jgi:hypothetical protein
MNLSFDHLVHFLRRNPAEAVAAMGQAGFHAVPGGRHPLWGTWNSLCYFGLSYVEFLAVEQEETARQSDNPLVRQLVADIASAGEGMGQIALRTTRMDEWAAHLPAKGIRVTGPVAGSRTRGDGSVIRWRMLFIQAEGGGFQPPFLIEWGEPDAERMEDLAKRGIWAAHPNGADSFLEVVYAVHHLEEAVDRWHQWLAAEAGAVTYEKQLDAWCQRIALPGGDVLLCQPKGDGWTAHALRERGERPFFARFGGGRGEQVWSCFGGSYGLAGQGE